MDEIQITSTITKMKEQIVNIAEDIKEIKDMLNKKNTIDEEQNKNIALLQNNMVNLQQQKEICSASKEESIVKLKDIVSTHHDSLNALQIEFDQHKEYEKRQQNKLRFQLGLMIPLVTTFLTFGIDMIMRFLHL